MGRESAAKKSVQGGADQGAVSRKRKAYAPLKPPTNPRRAEELEEEERKRKEDEEEAARNKWVANIKGNRKSFTCERQVDRESLKDHSIVTILERQGLSHFFKKVGGYKPKLVKEFYANMVVNRDAKVIKCNMGDVTVTVTPKVIAAYLKKYRRPRPSSVTYPTLEWYYQLNVIKSTLTEDPETYQNFEYTSGGLKPLYRLINQVVHYNLYPKGNAKTPSQADGDILFAFGNEGEVIDWALWIWTQMADFKARGPSHANIPFPAMVTVLCENDGVQTSEKIVPGLGPINQGSLRKSDSMSKRPPAHIAGLSRPTAKSAKKRREEWDELHYNHATLMLEGIARIEAKQRGQKKRDGKKMRRWIYISEKLGSLTGDPYKETAEDKEEDTEEEEGGERLYDFSQPLEEEDDIEYHEEPDEEGDDDTEEEDDEMDETDDEDE